MCQKLDEAWSTFNMCSIYLSKKKLDEAWKIVSRKAEKKKKKKK